MMHKKYWSIITYDVRCPKRLQRLHRFLRTEAYPIQESVFAWFGSEDAKCLLQDQILKFINKDEDDVRGYRLKTGSEIQIYGLSPFGNDIFDSGCPPHRINSMIIDEDVAA